MNNHYPSMPGQTNGNAVASLIIGILSWVIFLSTLCLNFAILPLLTIATMGAGAALYICTIVLACLSPIGWLVGAMLGNTAKSQIRRTGEDGAGMANAGFIMNLIGLVLTGLFICGVIAYIAFTGTAASLWFLNPPSY